LINDNSLCAGNKYSNFHNQDSDPGSIVLSMMIPYVQEISTGSSATRIPGQGSISDDSLSAGNKYWKFHN
jgi:hypothetical protein